MKKYIALLCVVLILVGLAGCGAAPESVAETEPKQEQVKIERIHQAVFRDNFEQILAPIADDFKITELPPVELEDGGACRSISIIHKLVDDQYSMHIYYDADGLVELVLVNGDKEERANLHFAIMSIYAYQAMGFEAEDPDVFYEEFAMLTPEPSGFKEVAPGVLAHASNIDELLTFAISYNTENAPE